MDSHEGVGLATFLDTDKFPQLVTRIVGHLTLPDILQCRLVSRKVLRATEHRCIPQPAKKAMFLVVPRFRGRHRVRFDTHSVPCPQCAKEVPAAEPRCVHCDATVPPQPTIRLFIGQLSVHRTAQVTHWMLGMIMPDVRILQIGVHTARVERSKGCAWIEVTSAIDERRIMAFDRRALFDAISHPILPASPTLGLLICNADRSSCTMLREYAERRLYLNDHGLPSQPIVVERPAPRRDSSGLGKSHPIQGATPVPQQVSAHTTVGSGDDSLRPFERVLAAQPAASSSPTSLPIVEFYQGTSDEASDDDRSSTWSAHSERRGHTRLGSGNSTSSIFTVSSTGSVRKRVIVHLDEDTGTQSTSFASGSGYPTAESSTTSQRAHTSIVPVPASSAQRSGLRDPYSFLAFSSEDVKPSV